MGDRDPANIITNLSASADVLPVYRRVMDRDSEPKTTKTARTRHRMHDPHRIGSPTTRISFKVTHEGLVTVSTRTSRTFRERRRWAEDQLGGVPHVGDVVSVDGLTLTVESTDGRRVGKVLAVRAPRVQGGEGENESG